MSLEHTIIYNNDMHEKIVEKKPFNISEKISNKYTLCCKHQCICNEPDNPQFCCNYNYTNSCYYYREPDDCNDYNKCCIYNSEGCNCSRCKKYKNNENNENNQTENIQSFFVYLLSCCK